MVQVAGELAGVWRYRHDAIASSCILILLDGLGDRSYPALGHRTPLQVAYTPNLDRIAAAGCSGLFHPDRLGFALPSENAHFAMFGYQPEEFPGRGVLEALGAGIDLADDEIALLAHFVSVDEKNGAWQLVKDRPKTGGAEAQALGRLVASYRWQEYAVRYVQTKMLDGIVVISGPVSRKITDTDPIHEGLPLIEPEPYLGEEETEASPTAEVLRRYLVWCHEQLRDHTINADRVKSGLPPINFMVTQRAGTISRIEPFAQRWGLRGISIASGIVYHGLARLIGLSLARVNDSSDPQADMAERVALALDLAREYNFVHLHTKVPDAAAHSKDPLNKVAAIEALDRALARVVEALQKGEILFVVTADHSTPSCGIMVHGGEPVPMVFAGPGMRCDRVVQFDEIHCAGGALGSLRGADFMPLVLNGLDMAKLQGLMDSPVDQPYWPGMRKPFRAR